ncbi:MAG: hypothetical protein ACE5HF_07875 [Gemmatimonadota bacterium]
MTAAALLLGLMLQAASGPGPPGQERPGREALAVSALEPDSTRVGEPFLLGVSVAAPPGAVVRFPSVLPSTEGLEQLAAPEISRPDSGARAWRAYYRMTAWHAGEVGLPDVEVAVAGPGGSPATIAVPGPTLTVLSVLPPDSAAPDLRPARPPVELGGWPWPWLLAALAVLVLLWLAWRALRRRGAREEAVEPASVTPAEAALAELARLREEREAGRIRQDAFYDGLEAVLKTYLAATRGRSAGTPVRPLPVPAGSGAPGVAGAARAALGRTQLVRFGRIRLDVAVVADAEACARWVEADGREDAP